MRANFFVGGEGGGTSETLDHWASQFFSASQVKKQETLEPTALAKILPLGWRQHRGRAMSGSLLDQCRKSILKIAETQPPDGRRAILMMAEMFRANSDRASSDGRPSLSQDFHGSGRPRRLRAHRTQCNSRARGRTDDGNDERVLRRRGKARRRARPRRSAPAVVRRRCSPRHPRLANRPRVRSGGVQQERGVAVHILLRGSRVQFGAQSSDRTLEHNLDGARGDAG